VQRVAALPRNSSHHAKKPAYCRLFYLFSDIHCYKKKHPSGTI
jgi:hypothetical protein